MKTLQIVLTDEEFDKVKARLARCHSLYSKREWSRYISNWIDELIVEEYRRKNEF